MKNKPALQLSILTTTLVLFLNGCGFAEHYSSYYQEVNLSYPTPTSLDGDVQNSAILLIDGVTEKSLNTLYLSGVAIVDLTQPEKEILAGSFSNGGFFSQNSGVVVFSNLPPSKYRIIKLKTENSNQSETVFLPMISDYELEIIAGSSNYIGQINIKHPFGTTDRKITLNYIKAREIEAWKLVTDKFKSSPWVIEINQYVKSIE